MRALRRLQLLNTKLAESNGRNLRVPPEYYRKLIEKLG
jgi:hypothetical protein